MMTQALAYNGTITNILALAVYLFAVPAGAQTVGQAAVPVVPAAAGLSALGAAPSIAVSPSVTGLSPALSLPAGAPALLPLASPAAAPAPAAVVGAQALAAPMAPVLAAPAALALPAPVAAAAAAPAPAVRADARASRPAAGRLAGLARWLAPHLAAAADASGSAESGRAAGERILAILEGRVAHSDAPAAPPGGGSPRSKGRLAPAIADVSFGAEVPAAHQALLWESLKRRKAGWYRGIAAAGIQLDGPIAPKLVVRSSRELAKGAWAGRVAYEVEWSQGELRLGTFRATIQPRKLDPAIQRGPEPAAPEETQLVIRFRKTVFADLGGLKAEASVTGEEVSRFLEEQRLRVLSRGYDGLYRVAVTGGRSADEAARALSARGPVLYATPAKAGAPGGPQAWVVFKKSRVVDLGVRVESAVGEEDVAAFLRRHGLRVHEVSREGAYRVSAAGESLAALESSDIVLYASGLEAAAPEERQVIVSLRKTAILDGAIRIEAAVSDDDVAGVLRSHRLSVLADYGDRTYRVAGPEGSSNEPLASALQAERVVLSAVRVGAVSDERVRAAAAGAASHKGMPWSQTEYSAALYYARAGLELAGATAAQLAEFGRLCDAAPVRGGRFNPWSGD